MPQKITRRANPASKKANGAEQKNSKSRNLLERLRDDEQDAQAHE